MTWRLESLERRVLLSTSIPLNTSSWTLVGPAPLTNQGVANSGRILDIAAHPVDADLWYVATASGGVWKTTNAGAHWTPLTDDQPINFTGSIALAPSNPDVIYVGTGEATWGPSKKILRRDNIYYGRGVLKSTDGGENWTLLGQNEFYRRSIGKIIVHPQDSDVVYAAVGATANNGLPGNHGVWKSTDGGLSWNNTTASISTTAAVSDLVMHPNNPQVLYAAFGQPEGHLSNGIYFSQDGGANWTRAAATPTSDIRIGRTTLAISTGTSPVVYASMAASGQGGTVAGTHYRFVRSDTSGTSWTAGSAVNVGGSMDYNVALAVDPANPSTVYIAGKSGSAAIQRSTNGGSSWQEIGFGTQTPHPDHHALVFSASGKLLDGNDGGIWTLESSSPVSWSSRNGNLATIQFVGIALHPSEADLAYGGSQDNGTERFFDSLSWPVIQGGDGGVIRVDPLFPGFIYHTFYYSGSGFFERSNNGGLSWSGKTGGINIAADSAYFYPPFVIDPVETRRLVLGTNRVYETVNRADLWSPISTPDNNGWVGNDVINAVALAKTDPNVIYATAEGKIFVTTDRGATWSMRNIPGVSGIGERFTDIAIDPADANTVYIVRGRFGAEGRVWRSVDAGLSWDNLTANLPEAPLYSVELDARGPGPADDVIWVGGDSGLYASTDLGTIWSPFGSGLPIVQAKDIEYMKDLGILAIGTHGRGMWQISVPDVTRPVVTQDAFNFNAVPHALTLRFSEDVSASLSLADIIVQNLTAGSTVPSDSLTLSYDRRLEAATVAFTGFDGGILPDGRYRATINSAGVTDGAANALASDHVVDFYFLQGDANRDEKVNLSDFNILAANFGQSPRDFTQGDFTYDGMVNLSDFNILASRFGATLPASRAPLIADAAADRERLVDVVDDISYVVS